MYRREFMFLLPASLAIPGDLFATEAHSLLMLPVVEDTVLARRAAEGRYGIQELLLYSSVCGTGLDVVPVPGDSSTKSLELVIGDVRQSVSYGFGGYENRLNPSANFNYGVYQIGDV